MPHQNNLKWNIQLLSFALASAAIFALSACPAGSGDPPDAGVQLDGGTTNARLVDAGPVDAGPVDAGPVDAGTDDAGPDYEADRLACEEVYEAVNTGLYTRFQRGGPACSSVADCVSYPAEVECPTDSNLSISLCTIYFHRDDEAMFLEEIQRLEQEICTLNECQITAACIDTEVACVENRCTGVEVVEDP